MEHLGKTSKDAPITVEQINKEIKHLQAKIKDNCNIQAQLKREDKALKNTIKLLKLKRTEIIFAPLQENHLLAVDKPKMEAV